MRFTTLATASASLLSMTALALPTALPAVDPSEVTTASLETRNPLVGVAVSLATSALLDLGLKFLKEQEKDWTDEMATQAQKGLERKDHGKWSVVVYRDEWHEDDNNEVSFTKMGGRDEQCQHVEFEPWGFEFDTEGYKLCIFKQGKFEVTATEDQDMWGYAKVKWCEKDGNGISCSKPKGD